MDNSLVIKKLRNKKYFCAKEDRYISLKEIYYYTKAGIPCVIIDQLTKKDITQKTLGQLLVYSETFSRRKSKIDHLRDVINNGDGSLSNYIVKYLGRK